MPWYARDSLTECLLRPQLISLYGALSQPRMYTKLAITGRRVLASTEHPNRLIMWHKHEYTVRVTGSKKVRYPTSVVGSWEC